MRRNSQSGRLPVQRIAITVPPATWFHGITQSLVAIYRQGLVELGPEVFDVPVDAFFPPDAARIAGLLSDLRAFRPEMAIGLSHGHHAVNCRLPAGKDGWRPQLFTEVLDIPTICIWDHTPFDIADQLFHPQPAAPGESTAGASETLRRVLEHPRMLHWSRDTGQARIMSELGFLRPDRIIHEPSPCLPGFFPQEASRLAGVGFVGHFYQQEAEPYAHHDLAELERQTIAQWLDAPGRSLWDVLNECVASLEEGQRRELALEPEQTYFWHFAHRLIVHRAQTAKRLKLLGGARVPIVCYGNLQTDGAPGNLFPVPGHIEFGPPLAAVLAQHEITLDVMNPGFVDGYSHKPLLILASGGFLLMDRKQDFIDAFGDTAEAVSYQTAEQLGARVEQFLANPKYRREVGDELRQQIALRFSLRDVLRRVILAACRCMETSDAIRGPVAENTSVIVGNLLPALRAETFTAGSTVDQVECGVLVTTSPRAWEYAAGIYLPETLFLMREPHLRVTMVVEAGKIGVAATYTETAWPPGRAAGRSHSAIRLRSTIELPREGVNRVILRSAVEAVSRVRIIAASLCDRAV